MKFVKVTKMNYDTETFYNAAIPMFALCKLIGNGTFEKITALTRCRDGLIQYVRQEIRRTNSKIDQKKTRLLLLVRTSNNKKGKIKKYIDLSKEELAREFEYHAKGRSDFEKKFRIGHKVLNYFEKKNKWPLSRLYRVDPGKDAQQVAFLLVGSKNWQKTPHYLSLYVLIARTGFELDVGKTKGYWPTNKMSHENIIKTLAKIDKSTKNHYSLTASKWDILMKYQKQIVGKDTMKQTFDAERLKRNINDGYGEGVAILCSGNSYDIDISRRFQKVCQDLGVEQRVNMDKN